MTKQIEAVILEFISSRVAHDHSAYEWALRKIAGWSNHHDKVFDDLIARGKIIRGEHNTLTLMGMAR